MAASKPHSLDVLAEYDENPYRDWRGQQEGGAPVEPDGTPVYYRVPESFEKAKNDGQRWRWALAQAAEADPGLLNTTRLELAGFLLGQFGTQTMAGLPLGTTIADGRPEASGPYAVDTLEETKRSPGLRSAPNASGSPMNSTRSRSIRRSPLNPRPERVKTP